MKSDSNLMKQTPAEAAHFSRRAIVELQQHYGKTTVYPLNRQAGLLAEIAGTKTLTRQTIQLAAALGFSFEVRYLVGIEENHAAIAADALADLITQ
jgi:histone H3/H4